MNLPIYQIDAFTDQVFGGNPAAVVVMPNWLKDERMQAIAAENNLAETAFVIPRPDSCALRWFTPTQEIDLCGHATLATAFVLFQNYFVDQDTLDFATMSGTLTVKRNDRLLAMEFPARPGRPIEVSDELASALGARPQEAYQARDLLAVFSSEEQVRNLAPDFKAIASLDALGVIASAPGSKVDFVSRFFAPKVGVPEDPVTGSSHCTLAPYWAERLGKLSLSARQLSARGGDLFCEVRGEQVVISGTAVEYLRGEITAITS